MSETISQEPRLQALEIEPDTVQKFGHTVFEALAEPIDTTKEIQATGPTQAPTHLGGKFMGIDQDRDA